MFKIGSRAELRRLGLEALVRREGRAAGFRAGRPPRLEAVIASVLRARIEGDFSPGGGFRALFDGARLLTLNELLRLHPMARHRYRTAWHRAAHDAMLLIAPRARLEGPLAVEILRRSRSSVDNDGLAAALKFAIDGFRAAGLISGDDPSVVAEIRLRQEKGPPAVEIRFLPFGGASSSPSCSKAEAWGARSART